MTGAALPFLLGAACVALVAVPLLFFLRRRLATLDAERKALGHEADLRRHLLAATPDGLYVWDAIGGGEHCSRRLAVLLELDKGTASRIEDVLFRFEGEAAASLHQAVRDLRHDGSGFDLTQATAGGRRRVRVIGVRCSDADGGALAELLWVRDADNAPRAPDTESDEAARVRDLLDALPVPVWLRNADLSIAFANNACGDGLIIEAGRNLAVRARESAKPAREPRLVNGDGSPRLYEISEAPLADGARTLGVAVDRTPSPAPATDPLPGERLIDTLRTAMAVYGPDMRLRTYNSAFAELWELDRSWLDGGPDLRQILERLREGRRLPEFSDFRVFSDEQLGRFNDLETPAEDLMHLPDGTTLHCVVSPDAGGGLVFAYEDMTDHLDLERTHNTLVAVQRETLDNLHQAVAVFGSDGRLKLNNPAFAGLWGLNGTDDENLHVADFVDRMRPFLADGDGDDDSNGDGDGKEDTDWAARRQDLASRLMSRAAGSGRLVRTDGIVLEYADVPLPDGAVLLSYLDITDRFKVEQALRQRAEAMSEADRLKSEFIANVSHELRVPLTSIIGFAEVLTEEYFGGLNARQADYSRGILEASRDLMAVLGDILDLATIEAGMIRLELDTVELHTVLAGVLALIRERARRKGLELDFDCPPDIGWIVADEKRLKQVVFNLLSNAVRFTPPRGTVGLAAERRGDDIAIIVSDNGIGIPQGDQDRMFDTFERRGDGAGAGLGLSLVKRFVEMHGGRVDIESAPGKGTAITCILPAGHA
jgi:signal transduction histidine kinase